MAPSPLIDAAGAAQMLNVRVSTIRAWTMRGRLPHVKLGTRLVRYRVRDLDRFIRGGVRPGGASR